VLSPAASGRFAVWAIFVVLAVTAASQALVCVLVALPLPSSCRVRPTGRQSLEMQLQTTPGDGGAAPRLGAVVTGWTEGRGVLLSREYRATPGVPVASGGPRRELAGSTQ
jgi:hypothetical protein